MRQFLYPYILLSDIEEKIEFYKEAFGGEVVYTMLGKDIPNCPEDELEKIMHLEMRIQGTAFFFADSEVPKGSFLQLHLDYEDKEEMLKAWNNLKPTSNILQDLQKQYREPGI